MRDKLFELIRQEQVIIFSGAGTSLYAGYPSGNNLKEIIYNSLSSAEKQLIELTLPLPNFVEIYCRIKNDNRKSLNRILINEFVHKQPKSTSWHKKLSLISHFKTIITTNYDSLFEKAYGTKGQVIIKSSHLTQTTKSKTEIFKIHGCISDVDNVIITNTDYNNFFKDNSEESVFWSTIKSRMAMNSILFLGYSLEDPNIKVVFDKICSELGNDRKKVFFISPNLQPYNIEYLKSMGINYIKMTSQAFLNQLVTSLEKNVVSDFNNKKITTDTLFDYSKNYGLFPNLQQKDGESIVSSFQSINNDINAVVDVNFAKGWDLQKELFNHERQKNFDTLVIPKDKIKKAVVRYGKIIMPDMNLLKIEVKRQPNIDTKIDLKFDNGFEYDDIDIKLFQKDNFVEIIATLKNSKCTIQYDLEDTNVDNAYSITHEHNDLCGKLKDEIEEMKLLTHIGNGVDFKSFEKGQAPFNHTGSKNDDFINYAETNLRYLEKLKIIENHYNIKLENFRVDSMTANNEKLLDRIICVINNECIEKDWTDSYKIELNSEQIKLILVERRSSPIFPASSPEIINLYGNEINIGYCVAQPANIEVTNYDDVVNGKTNVAIFKSKSNKLLMRYTKEEIARVTAK